MMRYGDFREVAMGGQSVGCTSRQTDGSIEATLYRPKAESNKPLGSFPSWHEARRAVRNASRAQSLNGGDETMAVEIIKVQVPLGGAAVETGTCLVYGRGHKHLVEQPVPEDARKALKGDPKGYFKAVWSGMVWDISERVADQNW
jgi:hypothetical protein